MNKQLLVTAALLVATANPVNAVDVTGNIGWKSDYIFRGVQLSSSSANAGLDVTEGGFYAGTWAANLDNGTEVDLYGGYGGQYEDFSFGIGATAYLYTDNDDFDTLELNLSGAIGIFSLDIAIGEYDFEPDEVDYALFEGTVEKNGFYGTLGVWTRDFEGWYLDLGYGNTLSVQNVDLVDWTISIVHSDDIEFESLTCGPGNCLLADETSIVLSISKSFGLYSTPKSN